jgi:flagellar hook-associated protein 3 FlgL
MQRVTNSILVSDLVRTLNERMRTLSDLENQMATGKRVYYASDDPAAAGLILELRNRIRQNGQFQENAENAVAWLGETDSVLQQISDLLIQARTDAEEGANGVLTPEDMMALAENVNGFLENVLALSNEQYQGKTLFGGTNTTEAAFIATRDSGTDWITAVTPNPNGLGGAVLRQVGNETIQINVNGSDLFQPDGVGGTEDIFGILITLRDALAAADPTAVGACLDTIDVAMANVSDSLAQVGSQVNSITYMQDRLLAQEVNLTGELSEEEDADLIEVMTQLTLEQNAYQAALNVGAMIIQPSLVSFI